jgi:lipoprotein-anchoring transpeptidase ErfK/SrfK
MWLASLWSATALSANGNEFWILVDTGERTLLIMQGHSQVHRYENISIGRAGTTPDKRRSDDKTPLGSFRIARMTTNTPFHRFFGLDYPTLAHAERAHLAGVIDQRQYRDIRRAAKAGKLPPQSTPLGGYIGIHGIGAGDPAVHDDLNWTNGCIALTNAQIDDLAQWIRIGMRVIVR